MKTIGLLGGMSWESSSLYYRLINEGIKQQRGALHSAKIVLYSVDFAEIETLQHQGNWQQTALILSKAAQSIERAGADFLVICTNTMHKVAPEIQKSITIPILHIADATGTALVQAGIQRVGLLGTRFTMEQAFYREHLSKQFNIEVLIPESEERELIHNIIYQELCLGKISLTSKQYYLNFINELYNKGAEAIILGCTEITLLIQQSDTSIPLYDTTALHAIAAIKNSLSVD